MSDKVETWFAIESRERGTEVWGTIVAPDDIQDRVNGITGGNAAAMAFSTRAEAEAYVEEHCPPECEARIVELPIKLVGSHGPLH